MSSLKSATLGFAVASIAILGLAQGASAHMRMSAEKMKAMNACMAMPNDAMMGDAHCMSMMKKMHISADHMKTMMSCKAMPMDDMMKNADCMSMKKMHPGMMKMPMGKM